MSKKRTEGKSPSKRGSSVGGKLIASPGRSTMIDVPKKRQKGRNPRLTVVVFAKEFRFEAYFYEKGNGDQGFVNTLKDYMNGKISLTSEELDKINLVDYVTRRVPNSDNETLTTAPHETYPSNLFIRYPSIEGSTPETRKEGLEAIKAFLQDTRFNKYPPKEIDLIDLSVEDETMVPSLDEYFMDEDIRTFVEDNVRKDSLNENFAETFPDFARKCWRYNYISDYGRNNLGYSKLLDQEEPPVEK